MDRKTNLFEAVKWNITVGDLVKIRKYDINGDRSYLYGIVIGDKDECQIEMFPYVNVFVFASRESIKCYPNTLEIISHFNT